MTDDRTSEHRMRRLQEEMRRELQQTREEQKKTKVYEQEFLLNMSHELLGLLNSIQILSGLLSENRDRNLSANQLNYARIIHDSGKQMMSVLKDVQDLARIMAGTISIHLEEISPAQLTGFLKQNYETACLDRGLYFNIELQKRLPEKIVTDRSAVEKILRNLISNAIKFTDHGGITVRIEHNTGSRHLSFAIEDTGIGIPGDKKEAIFEAFRSYENNVQQSLTGAGLGLSLSRALAGLLQGEIRLHSVPGKGSTFTLILPEPEGTTQAEIPSKDNRDLPAINSIRDDRRDIGDGDLSILIIENDPGFARILFDTSRECGFKCLIAEDGEAGLHMANEFLPKAIILDLGLPRLDGLHVLSKLKEHLQTQALPVVLLSGSDRKHEARGHGAVGCLIKPVSMDRLYQMIRHLKTVIRQGRQRIVVYSPGLNETEFPLSLLRRTSFPFTTAASHFDIKELLLNGIGRCLLADLSRNTDMVFELLESFTDHHILRSIPVLIAGIHPVDPAIQDRMRVLENQLMIISAGSDDELITRLERMFPETRQEIKTESAERVSPFSLFKGKAILLADSDRRNLYALSCILKEKEIDVITADTGENVMDTLMNNPAVSLLMLNMVFPGYDGLDLIRTIRTRYDSGRLPIIAFNDRAVKGDRQKCIQAGANDYLAKPIIMARLNAMLQVWLNP